MPFNRVSNMKSTVMFLLLLNEQKEAEAKEFDAAGRLLKSSNNIPYYIPGLMLIPIPEAGCIAGYIDMAFWAVFLYVLGSITYVIDSFYLWGLTYHGYSDDAVNPQNYWNTLSAVLFLLNALICFWDWYLQEGQLSTSNVASNTKLTGGLEVQEVPHKISVYYFYNNLFFLAAAVVYVVQATWAENPRTDLTDCADGFCGSFWINFLGSFFYLVSSIFSVLECFENKKLRAEEGLPPLELFSFDMHVIDWFGWGDWLYLIISVVALLQCYLYSYVVYTDDFIAPYYLTTNVLFLFDSLAYMIGYMLFIWDLRQALVTGFIHKSQLGAVSELLADTHKDMYDDNEGDDDYDRDEKGGHTTATTTAAGIQAEGAMTGHSRGGGSVVQRRSSAAGGTGPRGSVNPLFTSSGDRVSLSDIRHSLNEAKIVRERRSESLRASEMSVSRSLTKNSESSGQSSMRNTLSTFEMTSLSSQHVDSTRGSDDDRENGGDNQSSAHGRHLSVVKEEENGEASRTHSTASF